MPKYSYVGKYANSGSQNSFYKVKGKPYGFKSFPNQSLATFAHAVQNYLAPCLAPKVFGPVCRIRIPNYFVKPPNYTTITKMVLSNWGYLTEIAKPFICQTPECEGACLDSGCDCQHYSEIVDLLDNMMEMGVEYGDAHEDNFGYVIRNRKKILVPIDFGRESIGYMDNDMFPEVCWDGAEDMDCDCTRCCAKYEEPECV